MRNQGIHHRTKLETKTIHTFLTAWNLIILPTSCCNLIIKWPLSRRCEQNKPVMIPALLTKCWVRLGLKVSLLNPDGLLSLNCRHCLKAAEPHSWKAGFLGKRGIMRSRRGVKNSEGTQCKLLQPTDTMELYLDLFSQPCRSVFLFAKMAGIPFDFKHVDLVTGKTETAEEREQEVWYVTPYFSDLGIFMALSSASGYNNLNKARADDFFD